jgi:hypothetical protein
MLKLYLFEFIALSLAFSAANPVNSITDSIEWVFSQVDFRIEGNSEDAITSVIYSGDYFYLTGYSYSISHGGQDIIIYKIHNNGTKIWAKYYGSTKQEVPNSIVIDSSAQYVYVGGTTTATDYDNALIINLSSTDGSLIWYKMFGNSGLVSFRSLLTYDGSVFWVGYIVDR